MARPNRMTIEYFPHYVKVGRTICILENRFGNDGYAFWFKLLEVLGESNGHYYDCSTAANWEYLLAKTHVIGERAEAIIDVLVNLGKIDAELWANKRVIWVENFVNNLICVYRKRKEDIPVKPSFGSGNPKLTIVSGAETLDKPSFGSGNPTKKSKVEYSIEKNIKKRIEKKSDARVQDPCTVVVSLWNELCPSLPKVLRLSDTRRDKIRARLKEWGDGDKAIEDARQLFVRMEKSDFLTGRSGRWKGASFDWLFDSRNNWVKVMEGNYDNRRECASRCVRGNEKLGVGEYLTADGKRTYGTGKADIPMSAPPRPSEKYQWSAESQSWIML